MINVVIYRCQDKIDAIEISGHAESGPYGYDLVCAGVSAVSFGAINAALQLSGLDLVIEQGGEGGYLYVKIPLDAPSEQVEKAQLALETMIISLETIEREYNKFIAIKEVASSC